MSRYNGKFISFAGFIAIVCGISLGCITGPITGKKYFSGGPGEEYYDEVRQDYLYRNSGVDVEIRNCIAQKQICTGMTIEQVYISWGWSSNLGYGYPRYTSVDSFGKFEVYEHAGYTFYFTNGKLSSWSY